MIPTLAATLRSQSHLRIVDLLPFKPGGGVCCPLVKIGNPYVQAYKSFTTTKFKILKHCGHPHQDARHRLTVLNGTAALT